MDQMTTWLHSLQPYMDFKLLSSMAVAFGARTIGALAVFIVGRWLAGKVTNGLRKGLARAHVDPTLVSFLCNTLYIGLLAIVCIITINQLGIQTTSIAAIIAAAGLAVGLALQGSLSNFAAGVLIILYRPFRIGDQITTDNFKGYVRDINMFTTTIRTADNRIIIVPNSRVTGDSMVNYTSLPERRVDLEVPVPYASNIDRARKIITSAIQQTKEISSEKPPAIYVKILEPWGAILGVEVWTNTPDFSDVQNNLNENIWKAMTAAEMPFLELPAWGKKMQEPA